jgi:hypothetical protein
MEVTSDRSNPYWYRYWLESIDANMDQCIYDICGKVKQNRRETSVIRLGGEKLYMKCRSGSCPSPHASRCLLPLSIASFQVPRLYLDDRAFVRLLSPDKVVDSAEDGEDSRHQNRPVHVLRRDLRESWPEAEEQYEGEVRASKGVVCDTKDALDPPRAPDDWSIALLCGDRRAGYGCIMFVS